MNKYLLPTLLVFLMSTPSFGQLIWFGKKMSLETAETRWGRDEFDSQRFREGGLKARAKMASSIIRNKKKWIGKPIAEVRKELGRHDGYYFTDTVPAYLLTWGDKPEDEVWQIVFLPDTELRVKEIIIELNGS